MPQQRSVIVFSDKNVDKVPMLPDDNIFTGTNTFNGITIFDGTISGTSVKDEDDMASDSNTSIPTQQSVKKYIDDHTIDTSTHGVAEIVGATEVQTLTNKTIDADSNTISNLVVGTEVTGDSTDLSDTNDITYNADEDISANEWVVDEDDMLSNLATKVPTQQSAKAYADTKAAGSHTHSETDITDLGSYIEDISGQDLSTADNLTSAFITASDVSGNETDPVFSGWDKDYDDLTNKPTLYTSTDFGTDFGSADLDDLGTKNLEDLDVTVASKNSDYTIVGESMILVSTPLAADVIITLPDVAVRRTPVTMKLVVDGGANAILTRAGSATIDGASTKTLDTAYESITVLSDGTNWHIINLVGTAT